ncbi:unnamed protein product [Lupinus luteus]|uniref:Ribosomal protein S14 n=1 Tax=Lupinus luteus TaxID=3873 RepID=A0AAV1XJY5_LUPLU
MDHYGKEKFDSKGEEYTKIGTKINKTKTGNSWKVKREFFMVSVKFVGNGPLSKVPSLIDKWEIHGKLESLPRNSAPTRLHRRCFSTGRPRANYRDFGLSGHILREMVHACLLPGVTRLS